VLELTELSSSEWEMSAIPSLEMFPSSENSVMLIPSISHYNCFLCLLQESIPNVQIVNTEDPVAAE
jgi:hypothetical protein